MNKVEIIRKHIGSDDFYDLNGTEMLSKILAAMDEYAEQQVKNLNIPAVINLVCDHVPMFKDETFTGVNKCVKCGKEL